MRKEWDLRNILLFLIFIVLVINTFSNFFVKKVNAETFRLDQCITTEPGDNPTAYVHVVTH